MFYLKAEWRPDVEGRHWCPKCMNYIALNITGGAIVRCTRCNIWVEFQNPNELVRQS